MAEIMDGMSMDLENMNMEKLKAVFPECFAEGKLDIDKLLSLCGEYIDNDFEKYSFTWKGKAECLRLAQKRSTGTLRPCPEESVNWDTTQNLYIEGDNLEVLKLLQTAYFRKVKMIYIDPPYNTGNDFVYEDDFADPMSRYKEITQQTTKSNPETMGRFHTNWLNMMYPRLRLAANLLRDDGVIFISIDENEVTNLRKICDEVFGEENFVAQITVQTNPRGRTFDRFIAKTHEYIVVYVKAIDVDALYEIPKDEKAIAGYSKSDENGSYRLLELRNRNPVFNRTNRPLMFYPFYADPEKLDVSLEKTDRHTVEIYPRNSQGVDGCWTWGLSKAKSQISLLVANLASTGKWSVFRKDYLEGSSLFTKSKGLWLEKEMNHENGKEMIGQLFGNTPFDFPKSVDYIKKCLLLGTCKENDIILDFFSGSATTAHAVMQLNKEDGGNRKFICVQLPELCDENTEAYKAGYKNICEIGKERIRRAGKQIQNTVAKIDIGTKEHELNFGEKQISLMSNTVKVEEPTIDVKQYETDNLDIGFRVLKLDTSNLNTWDATPIEENQMELFVERMNNMIHRVKADRTDMDMVFEIMLKLGVQPTAAVEKKDINGKAVYSVEDALILICLDKNINPEDVEAMAEFAPGKIVISRDSFADDTAMSNAHYILKDREIELKLV